MSATCSAEVTVYGCRWRRGTSRASTANRNQVHLLPWHGRKISFPQDRPSTVAPLALSRLNLPVVTQFFPLWDAMPENEPMFDSCQWFGSPSGTRSASAKQMPSRWNVLAALQMSVPRFYDLEFFRLVETQGGQVPVQDRHVNRAPVVS